MMSAALLMLAGVEQAGKSAGSANLFVDQDKPKELSFAKSFSDRIDESALLQGRKNTAKEAPIGLIPGSNAAALGKKLDAVAAAPGEGKELTHAVQEIVAYGKEKNVASTLGGAVEASASAGSGAKAAVNDSAANNVAPAIEEAETTNDASSSSSTSGAVTVVLQASDNVVAPAGSTEESRPLVSSAGSASVQKEMGGAGKTKEISSARKTAKMPENTPTSKTVQKTIGIDGNLISKTAEASSKDAGAAPQGIVTGVVAPPKDDVSTTGNRFIEAIPGKTLAPSEVSPATTGILIHKETGDWTKAAAAAAETAMSSPDGHPPLTKVGGELEKAATAAVPAGDGGDNKIQSASGPTTMVHSCAGSMASGTAPIAVVSGGTPGEPAPTKVQVGDAGAHTSVLSAGSREQGELSMAATTTEAIPTMLKATPTALEVGIQDGTHGWLKVRAEMADGGVVNASVSAASSTGQEMLHRELPAITAYLQQERVAVNAIAVHTPLVVGPEQRSSTGMDGAGGQTPQGGREGSEPQQNIRKGMPAGSDEAMTYQNLHGVDEDGSLSLAAYASGGSWLSVRA
jgi:hypothetical protein